MAERLGMGLLGQILEAAAARWGLQNVNLAALELGSAILLFEGVSDGLTQGLSWFLGAPGRLKNMKQGARLLTACIGIFAWVPGKARRRGAYLWQSGWGWAFWANSWRLQRPAGACRV